MSAPMSIFFCKIYCIAELMRNNLEFGDDVVSEAQRISGMAASMERRLYCCAPRDHSLNQLAELHASQEILVTGIRSQRGEHWFNLKVNHFG